MTLNKVIALSCFCFRYLKGIILLGKTIMGKRRIQLPSTTKTYLLIFACSLIKQFNSSKTKIKTSLSYSVGFNTMLVLSPKRNKETA